MSSTETLETKSLVETVEARAQEYKALSEQLETLRTAFQQIVDLNDFTGKSANAIKGFYRAQIDVIEAWLDFIDMQIAFFQGIEGMADDFELGGKTLVEVPFLERELANSTSKAFNLVDAQQSNLQSIFSRINDLVSLDVFSKSDFEERMEDAEDKRKQTKQKVREFDQLLLDHYHQSSLHEQVIVGLIQEMLHASSQGGEISPVHFNEIIYQQSEVHQARQDAQELTSSYMQYQEELQENRELQAKIEEMENRPWYEKAWDTVCTFTGEITGYYDAKRASTGVDPVTGEKLTTAERVTAGSLAAAGFIPVVGWAGRALKGGKTAYTMSKGVKATDHVLDAYQNTKAFDILKKTEYGIYGLASYNGFSEYITGKDMFGNELSEEKRNQSLTQSLFMLGAGGASVAVDRMQAKNSLSTIFPTPKPPATVPKTPKPWSVNYAMKWLKEQIPEVRIVQDSMGGSYPVFMKRSGGEKTSSELGNYSERTFKERKIDVGKSDIDNLRKKWNVPETETVAVGKTDVRGLEDLKFEAGSPKVRKEAGLPDLDEAMPNRNIKAPGNNPLFTRHAEEGILNEFDSAVIKSGIDPEDVVGTLKLHQSNPSGVCRKCYQGLANEKVPPGVLKQLSIKYPNLILEVTSEVDESIKVTGRLNLKIKNGNYID